EKRYLLSVWNRRNYDENESIKCFVCKSVPNNTNLQCEEYFRPNASFLKERIY
ncbi:hypothetical protein L9F63_018150, partial [Diploptera punctata]